MIANAFDLPPMLLGWRQDVNRSTAAEMADEAFQQAVVPLAKLIADHLTRDVIVKRLGWDDLRFVWNELESRDEIDGGADSGGAAEGGRCDSGGGEDDAGSAGWLTAQGQWEQRDVTTARRSD